MASVMYAQLLLASCSSQVSNVGPEELSLNLHHPYSPPNAASSYPPSPKAIYMPVVLVVSAIILASILDMATHKLKPHSPWYALCEEPSCKRYRTLLNSTVDPEYSPCDNFYRFVCSGWKKEHMYSVHLSHMKSFRETLYDVLVKQTTAGDTQPVTFKVAKFFKSCLAPIFERGSELGIVKDTLRNNGVEWPKLSGNPNVLRTMANIRHTFDLPSLVGIREFNQNNGIHLLIQASVWVEMASARTDMVTMFGNYSDYYGSLVKAYGEGSDNIESSPSADDVRNIEKLALSLLDTTQIQLESNKPPLTPNRETFLSAFPRWKQLFDPVGERLDYVNPIYVYGVGVIEAFERLVGNVGEAKVHHYVGFLAVQAVAPFADRTIAALMYGGTERLTLVLPGVCLRLSESFFGHSLYVAYTQLHLSPSGALICSDLTGAIYDRFIANVRNVPWLNGTEAYVVPVTCSSPIIQEAYSYIESLYEKAPQMTSSLIHNWIQLSTTGFTEEYAMEHNIYSDFIRLPVQDYGYRPYRIKKGDLTLAPPYSFIHPMFGEDNPHAVNYGGLGFYLAMAMVHNYLILVLNDQDSRPELNKHDAGCYSTDPTTGAKVPKPSAVASLSLRLAFDAFQTTFHEMGDLQLGPPPLSSPTQVFFMTSSFFSCSNIRSDAAEAQTNLLFASMAEHAEAFLCPEGGRQIREPMCRIFFK